MKKWPPSAIEIQDLQDEIRALKPSERGDAYSQIAAYYGVDVSTARRRIPVGKRKQRVDAGQSRAVMPREAERAIQNEEGSLKILLAQMEGRGEIAPDSISVDQARRIRDGDTEVVSHTDAPEKMQGDIGFIDWCSENIELRGQPWSLDGHEYLREIYLSLESHPAVACRKAVQVAVSTALILEGLYRCDVFGLKAIHYLPTDTFAARFSDDRVGPLIGDSSHLDAVTKIRGKRGRDNKFLRHVGRGSYYVLGLFTELGVSSVDGDIVALDEVDLCNQENRKYASDRVQHSTLQHIREISKPTMAGFGIDEIFMRSDQRYWHLICDECGERTCLEKTLGDEKPMPMPAAFMPVPDDAPWAKPGQEYYRACIHCAHPLDMAQGEWIADNPDSHIRGYHVSSLYRCQHSPLYADVADQIMAELKDAHTRSERKHIYTSLYGFPFEDSDLGIDGNVIRDATGTHPVTESDDGPTYMGVDQGNTLHVVILKPAGDQMLVTGLYITEDWGDLARIHRRHNVAGMVIDGLPEGTMAKDAARDLDGHVCYYSQGKSMDVDEAEYIHGTVKTVTTDRTESLDEVVGGVCDQDILLPDEAVSDGRGARMLNVLHNHLKNLKRELKEQANGTIRWSYLTGVPNHFGMALNYAQIASETEPPYGDFSVTTRSYGDTRRPHLRRQSDYAPVHNHDAGLSAFNGVEVGYF